MVKAVYSVKTSLMTCNIKSECSISPKWSYALVNFVYDIDSWIAQMKGPWRVFLHWDFPGLFFFIFIFSIQLVANKIWWKKISRSDKTIKLHFYIISRFKFHKENVWISRNDFKTQRECTYLPACATNKSVRLVHWERSVCFTTNQAIQTRGHINANNVVKLF